MLLNISLWLDLRNIRGYYQLKINGLHLCQAGDYHRQVTYNFILSHGWYSSKLPNQLDSCDLMDWVGLVTRRSWVGVSGPATIVGGGSECTALSSTNNTTTEVRPLSKAPNPQLFPRRHNMCALGMGYMQSTHSEYRSPYLATRHLTFNFSLSNAKKEHGKDVMWLHVQDQQTSFCCVLQSPPIVKYNQKFLHQNKVLLS